MVKGEKSNCSNTSNSSATTIKEICDLFNNLQTEKCKKSILNNLTKLFVLIYNERIKRKLLYSENEVNKEDDIKLKQFFKKDYIILVIKNKTYTKYEEWLNECFDKFLNLLFQLIEDNDEVFFKKGLSLLFGSLQMEAKIYESIISMLDDEFDSHNKDDITANDKVSTNDISNQYINKGGYILYKNNDRYINKQNNSIMNYKSGQKETPSKHAFPIKLFKNIILKLLKVGTINIENIKYICRSYVCFYYDLNYFFLAVFKHFYLKSMMGNSKEEEMANGIDGKFNMLGSKKVECDGTTNLFIYTVLINSIKPIKKVHNFHVKKSEFMKKSKIDDLFLDFNSDEDDNLRGKRKNKFLYNEKKKKKKNDDMNNYSDKNELKRIFNYDSDDSIIIHSSSNSNVSDNDDENNPEVEFLNNNKLIEDFKDENSFEDFSDYSEGKNDLKKIKQIESIENKIKDRTHNFFIKNFYIENKVYGRLYSYSWFDFIAHFHHNQTMILQILQAIPLFVFPYTNNPYYFIDYFNYSYYSSSNIYVSLAALPGIFYILTEFNIGDIVQKESDDVESSKRVKNKEDTDTEENEDENEDENEGGEMSSNRNESDGTSEEDDQDDHENDEGSDSETKLNDNMYTDYYKRLYELIIPASFYYDGTKFLKIIYASIKNKMIPVHYVVSFLKKLLRVGCLTSFNISINILSVVYDILNYFKDDLHNSMFVSGSVFMNMVIKNDFFCYENLEQNFDKDIIIEMMKTNSMLLKDENEFTSELTIIKNKNNFENFNDKNNAGNVKIENSEDTQMENGLFSIGCCLPDKYQRNMNTLTKKELYMANHIFYEIILLNNHLCDNLRYYSNVYHYNFNDSSSRPHEFYNDPNKINWQEEESLFSFLKNLLSFKKKRDTDILPCAKQKEFSTIFI
ncbi:conserved Plasmodium protein, unknown function [Plasmodium vinckei vinckei]|uniref:CCAAT-binding factor domain-containing protein n=1 Tax=Plasmodium vinckei vinckei TaxID=54757 RepID=A0A449C042_PLAVN|nr:conserved Plasmodium protein, unknown function [Plasmodium vinckei vinckei]KEG04260.1 hypothetical protein YYE_01166 [Plasmodium vinckei vinckei]VEV58939.1 conserved Plasmodium protein, unknown function [Plasmodium vinckei vinckei]